MLPPINELYRDRSLFVTGGTGFLGKVLLEKVLYSVATVRRIYVLIRGNKRKTAEERWADITQGALFARVRRDCPERLDKVVLVHGDITKQQLGIGPADLQRICDEVSVVFHCAATIKFNDHLRSAVELNVRGVARVVALCRKMPKLAAFLHCSTAYSNCDRIEVEEKVYPPPCDVRKLLDSLEWMDDKMIELITPSLISGKINTYCFTKSLAEAMLVEEAAGLPVIIFRPSIVSGVWRDGIPGWVEGLHGVAAIVFACSKGALSHLPVASADSISDYIPVDIVCNMMIASVGYRMTLRDQSIPVMHCCSGALNPQTIQYFCDVGNHCVRECPMETTMGVPYGAAGGNDSWERLKLSVKHEYLGPAMDAARTMTGGRPFWSRVFFHIRELYDVLRPFMSGRWRFEAKALPKLYEMMQPEDRSKFNFDIRQVDWAEHYFDFVIGVKRFLAKEDAFDEERVARAKSRVLRMKMTRRLLALTFSFLIAAAVSGSLTPWTLFLPLAIFSQFLVSEPGPRGKFKSMEKYRAQQEEAVKSTSYFN